MNEETKEIQVELVKIETATAKRSVTSVDEMNAVQHRIISSARGALLDAVSIGEFLTAQQEAIEAQKYGQWGKWIDENARFDRTTAFRYMKLYSKRELVAQCNNLREAYRLLNAPRKEKSVKSSTNFIEVKATKVESFGEHFQTARADAKFANRAGELENDAIIALEDFVARFSSSDRQAAIQAMYLAVERLIKAEQRLEKAA
jgi:hypothetical protein